MEIMYHKLCFLVLLTFSLHYLCYGENNYEKYCVVHNLEKGFDNFFTNDTSYDSDSTTNYLGWILLRYEDNPFVEAPHYLTTRFLSPISYDENKRSCIVSKPIRLVGKGRLEINIHLEVNDVNFLEIVLVNTNDEATTRYIQVLDGLNRVLRVEIPEDIDGEFKIAFIGTAKRPTTLIIDSIRFLPYELLDQEERDLPRPCQFYPSQLFPPPPDKNERTFWNGVNITAVVLLCTLPICLVGLVVYDVTTKKKYDVLIK